MTINTALLIAAPLLQNYFVDKSTGLPLSAGIVTMYKDSNHQALKNWYYQTGTAGAYTYERLPNPLQLSAVGTIADVGGNDVIPFYYPYSESDDTKSEPYFVTVVDSQDQLQFTRANFPFVSGTSAGFSNPTLRNYIINNRFWRNLVTFGNSVLLAFDLTNVLQQIVAPSQHDGFQYPHITFRKDIVGAADSVIFNKFSAGSNPFNPNTTIVPEFYLEHDCSTSTTGEGYKLYQFPISLHIETLESQQATFSIWARNLSSASSAQLNISVFQDLGTNTAAVPIPLQQLTLTSEWIQYLVPFTFPSAQGKVLSPTGDDALYIQVGMPLDVRFDLGFTLPSLILGKDLPTNDFDTYDQIDTVINSPSTGDFRMSLNSFGGTNPANFGWVPANDQTIGSLSSGATTRADTDTWPLFNLIWNNVSNTYAPIQNSSGVPVSRGTSAYADFVGNNRRLVLTLSLGRVFAGGWNNTPHVLGFTEGSSSTSQVPNHTHPFTANGLYWGTGSDQTESTAGGSFHFPGSNPTGTTDVNTGGVSSISLMQPTTYVNFYFKL